MAAVAVAVAATRTMLRSTTTSGRSATAGVTSAFRPRTTGSPIRFATQKPLSSRIFRSPVELSCVGVLPYHSATASALLTSMLTVTPRIYGWTIKGL